MVSSRLLRGVALGAITRAPRRNNPVDTILQIEKCCIIIKYMNINFHDYFSFKMQCLYKRNMSSVMLGRVALVRTDVLEEPIISIIRVARIDELGTTLA
jgi:hypothetical protein